MKQTTRKAVIIHPGAIGDCILTLPLAEFLKQQIGFDQVHMIARMEYTSFYPSRTVIDRVRSMEAIPFYRLFEPSETFDVEKDDRLVAAFSEYEQVISFLGNTNPAFEQNLLYVVHCSHAGDVTLLPLMPSEAEHAASYYIQKWIGLNNSDMTHPDTCSQIYLTPRPEDRAAGIDILNQLSVPESTPICLIHPGSGGTQKCWPLPNFIAVAKSLKEQQIQPVFVLGPVEIERFSKDDIVSISNAFPLVSGRSLDTVINILSCTDYCLGNDSGISHIAGAMGKKTIVLFGPTNPIHYRPLGPRVIPLQIPPVEFQSIASSSLHLPVLTAITS